MKTIQVRLPDAIHSRAKRLSLAEQVSMNQFIASLQDCHEAERRAH